jgi:hypothetical protein
MVTEINFRFRPSLMGSFDQPQPPIPHLGGIIVLQRGQALVGYWDAEVCGFMHPANQRELAAEALAAVLESYPDADLTSDDVRFFTCPKLLAARMDFENW